MNNNSKNISYIAGVLGGITVIALFLILVIFSNAFSYKAIYIVNPETKSDSLSQLEIVTLKSLETKGLLTTPDQYANNIASYYNTFVAFLTILFVVFSYLSYYSIKKTSRKDIEVDVEIALKDMLRDSIKFRDTVLHSIYGKIEENFVDYDDYSSTIVDLDGRIDEIESRIGEDDNGETDAEGEEIE